MAANLRAKAVLTMSKFAEDMVQFTGVISLLYKTLLLFDKIRPNTVIEWGSGGLKVYIYLSIIYCARPKN